MSENGQATAEGKPSGDVVSLQSVVDAHLHRLVSCQSAVLACHAGLLGLDEAEMDQYRALTPPLPTIGDSMTFLRSARRARQWLAANTLRDVIMLHVVYFEQMRQFLGLARIIGGGGSEEEKSVEARAMVADKPADTSAVLARLDDSMDGAWPRKQEFRSLEKLYAIFAALAAGQGKSLPVGPVTVELCLPEIKGQPDGGTVPYAVREVTKTFAQPAEAEPDRELFYEIFFTAFVICKDTSEAVATMLAAPSAPSAEPAAASA